MSDPRAIEGLEPLDERQAQEENWLRDRRLEREAYYDRMNAELEASAKTWRDAWKKWSQLWP